MHILRSDWEKEVNFRYSSRCELCEHYRSEKVCSLAEEYYHKHKVKEAIYSTYSSCVYAGPKDICDKYKIK